MCRFGGHVRGSTGLERPVTGDYGFDSFRTFSLAHRSGMSGIAMTCHSKTADGAGWAMGRGSMAILPRYN